MLLNAGITSASFFAKIIEKDTASNPVSFSRYGYELKSHSTRKLISNTLPFYPSLSNKKIAVFLCKEGSAIFHC
jgi:hypothetical protein